MRCAAAPLVAVILSNWLATIVVPCKNELPELPVEIKAGPMMPLTVAFDSRSKPPLLSKTAPAVPLVIVALVTSTVIGNCVPLACCRTAKLLSKFFFKKELGKERVRTTGKIYQAKYLRYSFSTLARSACTLTHAPSI